MNLAAACGWTLLRSLIAALVLVPLCWWMRAHLSSLDRHPRAVLWTLLLTGFFTPTLLTGYAYSNFSLALVRHPGWNEVLYSALLGLRLLPVGVLMLSFAPPAPVSAESLHCARLHLPRSASPMKRVQFLWPFVIRGPLRSAFPAFGVVFLLVFQEFEMASLMGTTSWTVWLFDAQTGWLPVEQTLRYALLPAICETGVLFVLLALVCRSQRLLASRREQPARASLVQTVAVWAIASVGCLALLGLPFAIVSRDTIAGLQSVLENRHWLTEIGTATGFGLISAGIASALAVVLWRAALRPKRRVMRGAAIVAMIAVSVFGLLGSLVVTLAVLWLFQRPMLHLVYDTPVPAALALVLYLLPRALLLQLLFDVATPQQGVHFSHLLRDAPELRRKSVARELIWNLQSRKQFLAAGILFVWGYLELTPVKILAPVGMTSVPVRLYDLMHYGRSMVLSALVALAMLAPPLVLLVGIVLRRLLFHSLSWMAVHRQQSSSG